MKDTRQQWAVEHGTLWALELGAGLPPSCSARVETVFEEVRPDRVADLTTAMNLATPTLIRQRFQGKRRCFVLKVADQIAAYGWVTHGVESVGELEREFNLRDDEAYIWDCVTLPAQRGQHCYSALLSHIIYQLQAEGTGCLWIGASRQNEPSVRGFVNAGFQHVIDLTYRRLSYLTILWFHHASSTVPPHLLTTAYRILVSPHERRLGRLALGYKYDH